jgi:nitrogen fixation/metabolism regulation signal transduction histidine kinase
MQIHLPQEHPVSHAIETATEVLLNGAVQQMESSQATFDSDQTIFTWLVVGFSAVALLTALVLGFVLTWSFLLPLRTVHRALASIAAGRFDEMSRVTTSGAVSGKLASAGTTIAPRVCAMTARIVDRCRFRLAPFVYMV